MRLSCFNHYVQGFPEAGETLIHNTFSGAYVIVADEVVDALRKADRDEALSDAELALVLDADLRDPDVGIVVESREAEEAEFLEWFQRRRSRKAVEAIVGINLACNFECPYCAQAGVLDGTVMKPEVADATADWLAARANEVGADSVYLMFVGGEPLLHPDRVVRVAQRVRARVGAEVSVRFSLITNGYFLTPEMVERMLPYGLERASVTLDGDHTTHSLTRVSKKGEDTFQRIFDNVIAASRRIQVSVNGNYQTDTVHGFGPLLERLAAASPRDLHVRFSPALEMVAAPKGSGSGTCTWSAADTQYQTALHDLILSQGFDTPALNAVGPCEFHDANGFAVDPSGHIYKCPGFLGMPEWGIGDVRSGLTRRYDEMMALTPKQAPCGGCSHRPNCGGGCLAAEWIRTGDTDGVNCEKGFFESVLEEATVRGYLLATEDSREAAVAQFPPPSTSLPPTQPGRSPRLRVVAA